MKPNNPKFRPFVNDEKTRLVSVRLEPRIVDAIDNYVRQFPNYTRTEIIKRLLYDCVALATPEHFGKMVALHLPSPDDYEVQIVERSNL